MNERERKTIRHSIGAIALVVAFIACTNGGETYTLVTDCLQEDVADAGCDEGGVAYTCNNAALPSDSDPTLICENGSPGANGSTVFCCTSQSTTGSGCTSNGTCAGGEISYLCTGAGSPSQSDSTLICEADPASGANAYCCIAGDSGATTSCTEQEDAGCTSGATAYVCPSSTTPDTTDPTLNCSAPTILTGGFVSYCCTN